MNNQVKQKVNDIEQTLLDAIKERSALYDVTLKRKKTSSNSPVKIIMLSDLHLKRIIGLLHDIINIYENEIKKLKGSEQNDQL